MVATASPLHDATAPALRDVTKATIASRGSACADEAAALAVDEAGLIRDACVVAARMFDYRPRELLERPLQDLLPMLAGGELMQDGRVNPRLAFLTRCVPFVGKRRDGSRFACRIFLNKLDNAGRPPLLVLVRDVDQEGRGRGWMR